MTLLCCLILLYGLLHIVFSVGAVFAFAFCFIMGVCIIAKNLFFPKSNDYLGPLI